MSAHLTAGRCWPCQGKRSRPIVYQWRAGRGRRLFNAYCPKCQNELSQTVVSTMKNPVIMTSSPWFAPRGWEPLTRIAKFARERIKAAEADGLEIGDGDVVDLIADQAPGLPLDTIREALVVAGLSQRFPNATHPRMMHGRRPKED